MKASNLINKRILVNRRIDSVVDTDDVIEVRVTEASPSGEYVKVFVTETNIFWVKAESIHVIEILGHK
jgi:hypothetical protein